MSRWLRRYSSAFQDLVNECPECGAQQVIATPFCPMCGEPLADEGQVTYTKEQCGREK